MADVADTTTKTEAATTPPRPGLEYWSDTQKILALMYSVALIVVIILLLFVSPKTDPQIFTLLTALVGVLATQASTIVQYYFGSTKNSQTKDSTILAQALGTVPPTPPTITTTTTPAPAA